MNCGFRVATPPATPLLVYDGDCHFCGLWIRRWRQLTGDTLDYLPAQNPRIARQFPEIPPAQFAEAVQLIETDGAVYSGAEAVFRTLAYNRRWQWPLRLHETSPLFARLTDAAYRFVAGHRPFFSRLTRLCWGRHVEVPSYFLARWLFLRALGVVYLVAFLSLGSQVGGLIGHNGILPVDQFMPAVQQQCDAQGIGLDRYRLLPTLCWWDTSNAFLDFQCAAGVILAMVLILGFAPAPCLFLLWLIYLSLVTVGQDFFGFQWDNLLLETGLLAIFLAPLQLLPGWLKSTGGKHSSSSFFLHNSSFSHVPIWLLRLLLFKLMFSSGCVKLLSGDPLWRHLTALTCHYQTQPLPTWIGWYAQQLPAWFQKFSCLGMFIIELGAPWLIFTPRCPRFLGCGAIAFLQVLILLTGNYTFFNWLTLALCLLLLDDFALARFIPRKWRPSVSFQPGAKSLRWPQPVLVVVAVILLSASSFRLAETLGWQSSLLAPCAWVADKLAPLRTVNNYGLFAVMTPQRNEIIVEGSNDGVHWLPYEFKYKPGDVKRRPGFVAPFQPRLDWQMWFAALGSVDQNPWFQKFCWRLLQGSPEVLKLLANNPFPDHPPRFIRAELYNYRFTTIAERSATGAWWQRTLTGEYMPPVSLRQ
jgi:predicted DCC family thiol-disulfide oxidoreductase YuxK